MNTNDSFADLMDRLKSGENDAARVVFQRFAHRLIGLARNHLDHRLTAKVSPEDVVQSAYKSFFLRQRDGDFEIGNWDSLWSLLTIITLRKCADRAAQFRTEKRDYTREVAQGGSDAAMPTLWQTAVDREPLPEEGVFLAETVEELFNSMSDQDERAILELSLQGYSATEISQQLNRAERSVRRLRERIRRRLERACLE